MKVAIIIPTYNRPEYLKRCFDSLANTYLPSDLLLYIIDDCSTNTETLRLINNLNLPCIIERHYKNKNKGINDSLYTAYNELFSRLYTYIIVLDSDAIVNNYFYDMMTYYHMILPNNIISGFNTLTLNEHGNIRHPIIENNGWHIKKNTVGGLCFGITKRIYKKFTKPVLEHLLRINKLQHFDTTFTKNASERKVHIVCTVPSVADHIGFSSLLDHNYNPDVAIDYKDYIEINKFPEPKIIKPMDKKLITVNMATYPEREESLRTVIDGLLKIDAIDKIRVYLNEYTKVPSFLNHKKIEYVIGQKNLKDTGKFYWAGSIKNEYYFTCDDDLLFSEKYLLKHLRLLNSYNNKIFVTLHGKILNPRPMSFKDISIKCHFNKLVSQTMFINFPGTGVMVFDNSVYSIPLEMFKYHGMTDLWIAKYLQDRKIPCLVRKHNANKIRETYKGKDTLYNNRLKMVAQHKEILDSVNKWEVHKI